MIGSIKTFGLALIGAVVLSAAATPSALAGSFDFGPPPTVVTGHSESSQEQILEVQNTAKSVTLKAKCTTASFEGTAQAQLGSYEEATVTATYGTGKGEFAEAQGCTVGGLKAQVLMNGCRYTVTGSGQAENTALVDIVGCTSGKQIEVKVAAGACALKIPEQNGLSHLTASQLSEQEATIAATATGIKVQQAGAATCPDGATAHTGTSGIFTGNLILKAFESSGSIQVTRHGHQYAEYLCGAQVMVQST